jgi:hypothetical protein
VIAQACEAPRNARGALGETRPTRRLAGAVVGSVRSRRLASECVPAANRHTQMKISVARTRNQGYMTLAVLNMSIVQSVL